MDNEKMMNDIMENIKNGDKIPSDLINQARRLANSKKGREILKELNDKGINKDFLDKAMQSQKPIFNKNVLIIRPNGIVKLRKINDTNECPSILHANKPINIDCKMENVKIWYDSDIKFINKRASKLANVDVHGIAIVYHIENDLSINELITFEKLK